MQMVLTETLHLHFSIEKYSTIWHLGGKKATISICESRKRWCLLASQTGVILLAPLLLFLSSYLISVLLWLGVLVWEENEETVVMAIFSFYKLLQRKRYWKPFMLHLRVPLFHPLICLKQLLREREGEKWTRLMMNVSCLHVRLSLTCKAVVCKGQCALRKAQAAHW